jgi:hypothetical protein
MDTGLYFHLVKADVHSVLDERLNSFRVRETA